MNRFVERRWLVGVLTLGLVLVALLAPFPLNGPAPQERHIMVSARSFAFDPGIVHVNRGDTVVVTLQAEDVVHGFYVDGYGVSTEVEPGRPAEVRFVADRPGSFRFRCSIACGNLHPFMIGKLIVGPNLPWLRAAAATLITALGALAALWPPRDRRLGVGHGSEGMAAA